MWLRAAALVVLTVAASAAAAEPPPAALFAAARCADGRLRDLKLGNNLAETIQVVRGRFVIETKAADGSWRPGDALGTFVAELIPPAAWRDAVVLGGGFCGLAPAEQRVRVVHLSECRTGAGPGQAALCGLTWRPDPWGLWTRPVVFQPLP